MSTNSVQIVNFSQDFIDTTREVFSTMAAMEVESKGVIEIDGSTECKDITSCMDITGILGFSGGRKGCILLSLPESCALKAVGGMLGIEFEEIDSDVRDGISELVNMIAGGAKTKLQSKGISFDLSIPNTVVGPSHQITAPASTRRTHLDFGSAAGDFFIEVYLKEE